MSNDTHGDQRRPLCLVVVEQQHGNTTPTIEFFDTSSSDIDPFGRDRASRAPADIAECDVSDTPPCPLPREPKAAFYRVSIVALKITDEILLKTLGPEQIFVTINEARGAIKSRGFHLRFQSYPQLHSQREVGVIELGIYIQTTQSVQNHMMRDRSTIILKSRQRELVSSFRCGKPAKFQRGKIVLPELLPFLPRIPTLPEEYKDMILMKYAVTVMNAENQVTSSVFFFVKLLLSRNKIPTVPPLTSEHKIMEKTIYTTLTVLCYTIAHLKKDHHNEISSRLLDLYKCMTLEFSHEAGTIWPPPVLLLTSVLAQQWFGAVDHECSRLLDFCNTLQILPIQTAVVGHVKQRLSEGSSKFGVVGNST
ncbi:hypothetical protein G5I_13021 [Acromyrmex echinatior]|uniref:Uncharacterized protein n=1 Tax=Acromyrmex echinatior TaxID=103372 RepID=F4X3V8_ACREC|nr:hypothetical protein G5I_13021 [Acromyrmex echinatior]